MKYVDLSQNLGVKHKGVYWAEIMWQDIPSAAYMRLFYENKTPIRQIGSFISNFLTRSAKQFAHCLQARVLRKTVTSQTSREPGHELCWPVKKKKIAQKEKTFMAQA